MYADVDLSTHSHPHSIRAPECLVKQSEEFHKQIITVLPGVHCAIGYGLANCILIEGENGNIIIDTLESRESAFEAKKDLQMISSKPIVAIIYTHNHADHIFGAEVFADQNTKIYAHSKILEILDQTMNLVQPITFQRASRQFGTYLTKQTGHLNCGIGSLLNFNGNSTRAYLPPTHTFDQKSFPLNIEGREFILYHAPGETDDQIVIHMPKDDVLFAADNIYKSFPNIYAIRGTTTRDARQWVSSLDLMRNLHAHYLIPSHTKPIEGKEEIYQTLTIYRDAIQFVHDQTVRWINRGLTPEEIIGEKLIQLPTSIREHPYLQECYGTVNWSIRAIFDRYLGWFTGKPSELNGDSPRRRAQNLIELGGGRKQVFEKAQLAFQEGKYQWALELIEALSIDVEDSTRTELNQWHCLVLEKLASSETSANGRNWLLTKSLEIQGMIDIKPSDKQRIATVFHASLKNSLMFLTVNFNDQKARDISLRLLFHFIDTNEKFLLEVRHSILDIQPSTNEMKTVDLLIEWQNERIWKDILLRLKSPMQAFDEEQMNIKNGQGIDYPEGILQFIQFLLLFTP